MKIQCKIRARRLDVKSQKCEPNPSTMRSGGSPGGAWGDQKRGPGGARGRIPEECDATIFPRGSRGALSDPIFQKFRLGVSIIPQKMRSEINRKIDTRKYGKSCEKCTKMEPKTMTKTHRKSITKLITKKKQKTINFHVFVKG